MRFHDPTDPRRAEWLVLDRPIVQGNPPAGANWPVAVGRECAELDTVLVHVWTWAEDLIRTR